MSDEMFERKAKLKKLKEEYKHEKRKAEIREYENKIKLNREGLIQGSVRKLVKSANPIRKAKRHVRLVGKIPKKLL
jgi:hypothetical protein